MYRPRPSSYYTSVLSASCTRMRTRKRSLTFADNELWATNAIQSSLKWLISSSNNLRLLFACRFLSPFGEMRRTRWTDFVVVSSSRLSFSFSTLSLRKAAHDPIPVYERSFITGRAPADNLLPRCHTLLRKNDIRVHLLLLQRRKQKLSRDRFARLSRDATQWHRRKLRSLRPHRVTLFVLEAKQTHSTLGGRENTTERSRGIDREGAAVRNGSSVRAKAYSTLALYGEPKGLHDRVGLADLQV